MEKQNKGGIYARLMTELCLDGRVKMTDEQKKLMFDNMAKNH